MARRPGDMDDDDRARVGQAYRTPAGGTQIADFEPERTPPPTDIEDLAHALWPLRRMGDDLIKLATQAARLDERATHLEQLAGGLDEIGDTREEMREGFADIRGQHGNNGKLGALKARVDALSAKAWWVLTAAVGGIGAAAAKLVMVTSAFTSMADRTAHNLDQIKTLQAQVQTLQSALLARSLTPDKD